MKIKIKNEEIELKYSFRAFIIFEKIAQHSFNSLDNFTDILILFYSVILASSPDTTVTFDDFIDDIDSDPGKLTQFTEWLTGTVNRNSFITKNEDKDSKSSDSEEKN